MPHQSESHAGSNGYPVYVERSRQRSRTLPWQLSGPSIACLIAVGLAVFAGSARADLWGYLDDQGGVLGIGTQTEAAFGHKHFIELLSVYIMRSPPLISNDAPVM